MEVKDYLRPRARACPDGRTGIEKALGAQEWACRETINTIFVHPAKPPHGNSGLTIAYQ
jgi:hypothetical protein